MKRITHAHLPRLRQPTMIALRVKYAAFMTLFLLAQGAVAQQPATSGTKRDDLDVTMQIIVDPEAKLPDAVVRRIPLPERKRAAPPATPDAGPPAKETDRRNQDNNKSNAREAKEMGREVGQTAKERAKEAAEQREQARRAAAEERRRRRNENNPNPPRNPPGRPPRP